jgi:hypothetical protein
MWAWDDVLRCGLVVLFAALAVYGSQTPITAAVQQQAGPATGYIGGTVRSSQGPEAGVWVIAETKDLPTGFIKTVVTDGQGRFMLPELPNANYSVWVRGYGLVDSAKKEMRPGTTPVTLEASVARTPQEAAKIYPGDYWLSMIEPTQKTSAWMQAF